jgi:hypothetical protein
VTQSSESAQLPARKRSRSGRDPHGTYTPHALSWRHWKCPSQPPCPELQATSTSNHPLHDRLQKQPLERLKRKSLSHLIRSLHQPMEDTLKPFSDRTSCEPLMPERWSMTGNDLEVRTSVPGLSHKQMESTHIQQALNVGND